MSISVELPKVSPSLGEEGESFMVDSSGNRIPVEAVVMPDASSVAGLAALTVLPGQISQVTGKEGAPKVGHAKVKALVALHPSTGAVLPLIPALATALLASLTPAVVQPKFQSAVRTATGSEETIAHGLAVVPSVVLISLYDPNGVSGDVVLAEGTHTSTNLKVTVTATAKYKVIALA